jgi:hypothetical protein
MIRSTALAVMALASASCGVFHFDVAQAIPPQEVPGGLVAHFLTNLLPAPLRLTIDVKTETEKQGTGPATSAALKRLTLNALSGNGQPPTFDFLDSVVVYAEASGLEKREVARLSPVPRGAGTIDFTVSRDVDLLPYLQRGATLTTTATGSAPESTFTFDGEAVVEIRF